MNSDRGPEKRVFGDVYEAEKYLAPLRSQGKRLVTTNGCFDILHAGHIRYLTEAAALGDLLVVGVNADAVVRRLKGEGRPVQKGLDRVLVVAALSMVDGAFIFQEDDPRAFLQVLRPDVHVKGGDYTEEILERPVVEKNGGHVRIVSYMEGMSTTSLVQKIRSSK